MNIKIHEFKLINKFQSFLQVSHKRLQLLLECNFLTCFVIPFSHSVLLFIIIFNHLPSNYLLIIWVLPLHSYYSCPWLLQGYASWILLGLSFFLLVFFWFLFFLLHFFFSFFLVLLLFWFLIIIRFHFIFFVEFCNSKLLICGPMCIFSEPVFLIL